MEIFQAQYIRVMPAFSRTQSELTLINDHITKDSIKIVDSKKGANKLALNLLKNYFNFAYIFLISPFRLVEASSEEYKIIKVAWLPQKCLCGIFNVLGVLWLIKSIRANIPENMHYPSEYFVSILQIVNLIIVLLTWKKIWINQSSFVTLATFIKAQKEQRETTCDNLRPEIVLLWKWGWRCVYVLCSTLILVSFNFGIDFDQKNLDYGIFGNINNWLESMLVQTKYTFFLSQQNGTKVIPESYSSTDYLLIMIGGIGLFQKYAWCVSCSLFLMVSTMILWITSFSFMEALEDIGNERVEDEEELNVITLMFKRVNDKRSKANNQGKWKGDLETGLKYLEQLSRLINDIISNSMSLFILQFILYYSTCYLEISVETGNNMLYRYARFSIITFGASIILRFGANIPFMVSKKNYYMVQGYKTLKLILTLICR